MRSHEFDVMGTDTGYGPLLGKGFVPFNLKAFRRGGAWITQNLPKPTKYLLPSEFVDNK